MKFIAVVILELFFACCYPKDAQNKSQISVDEYTIINIVLKSNILPDSSYKNRLLYVSNVLFYPPSVLKKDAIRYKIGRQRRTDSLKRVLDTAKIYLFVNDSLISFPSEYLRTIKQKIKVGLPVNNRYNKPGSVNDIILAVDTNTTSQCFNRTFIHSLYDYNLVFYRGHSPRRKLQYSPGEISVSRTCFNEQHTVACVYVETYEGPLAAQGSLVFLVKKNGRWIVIKSRNMWVA